MAPNVWSTLAGVLRLQPDAFEQALNMHDRFAIAAAIVLISAFSLAIGQSIVLFANRVRPARFALSVAVNALLFAFGYLFLVLSTFAVSSLPGVVHVPFVNLLLVLAFSYAPLAFAFF